MTQIVIEISDKTFRGGMGSVSAGRMILNFDMMLPRTSHLY